MSELIFFHPLMNNIRNNGVLETSVFARNCIKRIYMSVEFLIGRSNFKM